jgi:NTP pyrophosphatase (non-canonical NTP hydrolase)
MNFIDYQTAVTQMPLYDDPALGLPGEVGELLEHIKKDRRPGANRKPLNGDEFVKEAGDVLWYLTRLVGDNGYSMEDVANINIQKLNKRHGL